MGEKRQFLRHTLATLAYRGGKAMRGAPDDFAAFRVNETSRTPAQILTHIGDLCDWALSLARGKQIWRGAEPLPWPLEVERIHAALQALDDFLASDEPLACAPERLFQGPIADALTHVGQIGILRGRAGAPVRPENYFKAEIVSGLLGSTQAPPKMEF